MLKQILVGLVIFGTVQGLQASTGSTANIRFSPLSILIGFIDADLDLRMNDHIVAGPSLMTGSFTASNVSMSLRGFGGQLSYYPGTVFTDGAYFGGFVNTFSITASATSSNGTTLSASPSGTTVGGRLGYHWFWESFNLNFGLVLGASSVTKIQVKENNGQVVSESSVPGASAGLEFKTGFTF